MNFFPTKMNTLTGSGTPNVGSELLI